MGHDKALLPVGSQTLIEIVIGRIRSLVERVIVIGSPRNVQQLEERLAPDVWLCQAKPRGLAHRVLVDLKPDWGPLMGVYTGLMQTETALNLFVPCDMPWVEGRLIESLLRRCHRESRIVASRHPTEGVQPFPLVCHVTACRTIGAALDQQQRSLQALWREPHTQLVTIEDPGLWPSFTNVNTLADYDQLCQAITVAL